MTSSLIEPMWSTLERDDATIAYCRWGDDDAPAGVVLIAHGASEHAARYSRWASILVGDGYTVYGVDHRGHGRTADEHGAAGVARPGGWNAMVGDISALGDQLRQRHAGSTLILFGHSMGSMLSQRVMQLHGDCFDGVILSGTSGSLEGADDFVAMLQGIEAAEGADEPSALWDGVFAGFNEPFATAVDDATGYEWLSRDADEVRIYVEDPWCGGPLSNGFVTDMISGMAEMWSPAEENRIPTGLPILLVAGETDPVGDSGASVRELAERYEARGLGPVTLRLYPDARHEILNETNRDEVTHDLSDWIHAVTERDGAN